ncbi:alginate lyase family protein [Desmospora activa]|uniref:Heparinase II/III-like protein n=1 Tax=Desmospora activa DSM 45169 TaxID=1121389 RepID=A0A2T4Z1V6_9BACL|nr:alginate lyase family protein [Desmospora activa]PTM54754.1 heparinase II/III-like protein [Desmospora activa DSM 45169]
MGTHHRTRDAALLLSILLTSFTVSGCFSFGKEEPPQAGMERSEAREWLDKHGDEEERYTFQQRSFSAEEYTRLADGILEDRYWLHDGWDEVELPADLTWKEDPFKNRSWQLYLHNMIFLEYLTEAYRHTEDKKYLEKGKSLVVDWVANNPYDKPATEMSWHDHGTAVRLMNFVRFFEVWRLSEDKDDDFAAVMLGSIREHADRLASEEFYNPNNNHGIIQSKSLLQAGVLFSEFPQSKEWVKLAQTRLTQQVEGDVASDGVHKEHSPYYHLFVLKSLLDIREFEEANEFSVGKTFDERIEKMVDVITYLFKPDQTMPILGDSANNIDLKEEELKPFPQALYSFTQGKKGKKPAEVDRIYQEGGYAIFRSAWEDGDRFEDTVYLAFTNAFHSRAHKQADDLSFELYGYGQDWIVDSGKYNYKKDDPFRDYMMSVRAHNSIGVDGEEPDLSLANADGSGISQGKTDDGYAWVEGSHQLYDGVTITRRLTYLKPDIILVRDTIQSDQPHQYTQYFHLAPGIQAEGRKEHMTAKGEAGAVMEIRQLDPVDRVEIIEGEKDPVQGWVSARTNEKETNTALQYEKEGRNVTFATVLYLRPAGKPDLTGVSLETGKGGQEVLHIEKGNLTYELKLD